MSKYDALWSHIANSGAQSLLLTFDEIGKVAGIAIDHSFLNFKKELAAYGYEVAKISLKEHTVLFQKLN